MSWQRRLRLALAVFIPLFVLGVFFSVRQPSGSRDVKPAAPKVDPKAVVQSTKGRVVWSKGAQLDVVVEYEQSVTYADGSSKLLGVDARIPDRSDRDFRVKAREGRRRGEQEEIFLDGDVEVTSSDGLLLRTSTATYSKAGDMMRAPGPVTFSRGRLSGSSNGMTYEQSADVLSLLQNAVIHIAPEEGGSGGADIEAGLARLARGQHYVRFEQGVKIVREGQTTVADEAIAYFTDDEKYIKVFSLRGSSRITGAPAAAPSSGGLRSMTARDIDLYYRENSTALDHSVLTGSGVIELAGAQPRAVRRIAGETLDVRVGSDGATVIGLTGRQSVQLDLPAENGAPARRITSAELDATGPEGKGLTAATFRGGSGRVEFRELRPAPAAPRIARSATMDLAMPEGLGSIESARFGGGVRFEEGDMSAVSRDARYVLASGILALAGVDEATKAPPRVQDEQVTIEAGAIEIGLDGRKIKANDSVKSDLRPRKPDDAAKPGDKAQAGPPLRGGRGRPPAASTSGSSAPREGDSRLPSMLKQDQPVSATSDALEYDGEASHAVYTGHARLWQGETTIKGDRIVLDDRKGDLSASGSVVTTMRLEQVNEKTKAKEQVNSVATAKDMVYQDDVRRATYTGGAHLNGPQGDLRADKIELYLKEGGGEVERLEGYDNVTITTPEGRKATGARLTFLSADERYTMLGAPVKIVEECRETTGKSLTFFRSADRIIVDGNEQKRTETKGASACGSGPRSSD